MKITIVGTGYVGLVTGACFAEMGTHVHCIDIDAKKIAGLNKGIIPIYEPGLENLVHKNTAAGRLKFGTDLTAVIDDSDIVFSAVGTPPGENGSADLKYVLDVARTVGRSINKYVAFVTKSTVPVGTAERVRKTICEELQKRRVEIPFDVASNPEFLKEGAAIDDFMRPDRIVVGVDSDKAKALIEQLYKPFTLNGHPVIFMDIASAEMTKYAANAMLATRISFMNDIANLCECVGANVHEVRKGIGSDPRIGAKFLYPGCGYGGSCFPKDVKALIKTAAEHHYEMRVLQAVEEVNDRQKEILYHKLEKRFNGELEGKTIALWGLSFKPQTDDMREAPSLALIEKLLAAGCTVKTYDPVAMPEAKRILGGRVGYAKDIYETAKQADAILLVTEWKEFRLPDWNAIKDAMRTPVVLDGRNIYDGDELQRTGFEYYGLGNGGYGQRM
ncbi:MAG: UDP-glucose/GDP-mannose dehydrogenase family protein [Prevotellaceae bacterium]|jgi:UDPglucose 6-dehydrogenase|nr:UDP-glucose/GDP-mannose dehydrogenase family protein [Prevotellaceae bacterium]